jgi:hypothetical protein
MMGTIGLGMLSHSMLANRVGLTATVEGRDRYRSLSQDLAGTAAKRGGRAGATREKDPEEF